MMEKNLIEVFESATGIGTIGNVKAHSKDLKMSVENKSYGFEVVYTKVERNTPITLNYF